MQEVMDVKNGLIVWGDVQPFWWVNDIVWSGSSLEEETVIMKKGLIDAIYDFYGKEDQVKYCPNGTYNRTSNVV